MANYRRSPSWFAIVMWLIFFWPVGLYLLIKKLTTDREAAVRRDNKAPVLGWLLLIFGMFFLSSYFGSGRIINFFWALFFICGGLSSLGAAKKGNQEGERFRSYINAIVNHGLVSIQDIAAFAQVREKVAVKDLKRMIKMGYFDHAHIDEKRGEIYLYQRQAHANVDQRYYTDTYTAEYEAANRGRGFAGSERPAGNEGYGVVEKMTNCRNCGAQNWITPGVRNTCEFCGSPLSG